MSMSRQSIGSATWVAWLPLTFVGAMVFWTLALGLGGLSLVTVTALSADDVQVDVIVPPPPPTAVEPMPGTAGITVRLQESPEPEDTAADVVVLPARLDAP